MIKEYRLSMADFRKHELRLPAGVKLANGETSIRFAAKRIGGRFMLHLNLSERRWHIGDRRRMVGVCGGFFREGVLVKDWGRYPPGGKRFTVKGVEDWF